MNPASRIIDRCGGIDQVAGWTSRNRTSVLRWTYPRERGGTGGLIPSKHQAQILERAKAGGIEICAADFLEAPSFTAAEIEERQEGAAA